MVQLVVKLRDKGVKLGNGRSWWHLVVGRVAAVERRAHFVEQSSKGNLAEKIPKFVST